MEIILKLFVECRRIIIYDLSSKFAFQLTSLLLSIVKSMELGQGQLEEVVIKVYRPRDLKSWLHDQHKWLYSEYNDEQPQLT